jgi:hypothetical protein
MVQSLSALSVDVFFDGECCCILFLTEQKKKLAAAVDVVI